MKSELFGLKENVLQSIIELGKQYDLNKIIIYGSRARGDYKERSDIDVAVCGVNSNLFKAEADEKIPTLLNFDIVNLDEPVQQELKDSIFTEGVVVYEKI